MPDNRPDHSGLILGIDVGSVSISIVSMDLEGKLIEQAYMLHQGNIREALNRLMLGYRN